MINKSKKIKNVFLRKIGIDNLLSNISFLCIINFMLEDYIELGWIFKFSFSSITLHDLFFSLFVLFILFIRSLINFLIFKICFNRFCFFLNMLSIEVLIVILNIKYIHHEYLSGILMILDVITIAKSYSFYTSHKSFSTTNLTLNHYLYFNVSPTLCYESEYEIDISFGFKNILYKLVCLITSLLLFVFIINQSTIPNINKLINNNDILFRVYHFINISISTSLLFLIFFFIVFVCILDILAHITLFRDKNFYKSWYNSTSATEFWSTWNIPVHNFFKRYIYIPLLNKRYSKVFSRTICFFISAFFHEYVVSVATKQITGWIFIGMMLQIPYIYISEIIRRKYPKIANYFFWVTFCIIGQPTILILYYKAKR